MNETELENASAKESAEDTLLKKDIKPTKRRKTSNPKTENTQFRRKFTVPLRKKRKNIYNPKEEARLERLVFGDSSDVIENLLKEEETVSKSNVIKKPAVQSIQSESKADDSDEEDLEVRFVQPEAERSRDDDSGVDAEGMNLKRPVWEDDDDEQYTVEIALQAQNRKLPGGRPEKTYNELLQNKFKQLVGTPKWAELNEEKERISDDSDDDILRHSNHLATSKVKKLLKGTVEIKALTNINKETRTEGPVVTSLQFHPSSTVALVAGLSGILSIFQIDGRKNSKLHSMQYERFPINTARFTKEGSEIVSGSQWHSHCHAYDLIAGKSYKVPLPHGITNMKKFEVSPDGKLIALCGRMGEIHILTSRTKELVGSLKMNNHCNTLAFTPDSRKLVTHGEGGEIYVWDMKERACVHRAMDDGCLAGSTIAVSPSGQFLATGSKQGVVNVYDMDTVLQKKNPKPLKIILNLVTSITSLKFNPTSEILAMASDEKENAFKMVHLPSVTIFSNFPNFQTKLFNPLAIEFSPSSGYLGICNNKGSAYLYRLKHYGNY